jgi:Uma2 family endonuclease
LNSSVKTSRDQATQALDAAVYSQNQATVIDWMMAVISSPGSDDEAQLQCAVYLKNKFGRTNYSTTDEQAFRSGQAHIYQRLTEGNYLQLVTSIPNRRISEHIFIMMGNIIKSNINQYCKEHEEQDDAEKFKVINA